MDGWYQKYGTNHLSYEYQREVLDSLGLTNVTLVKGEVNAHSCDTINELHYAFLDMDLVIPMNAGYEAVRSKLVVGAYLLLHDVTHLPHLISWYRNTVLGRDRSYWDIVEEVPEGYMAILKRSTTLLHS
jgi:hypothetical protein